MENNEHYNTTISRFTSYFSNDLWISHGEDFAIVDMKYKEGMGLPMMNHPCRFDGYFIVFCIKGDMKVVVNMTEYELKENMFFFNMPNNIMRVTGMDDCNLQDLHYVGILISRKFLDEMHLEARKMVNDIVKVQPILVMTLADREISLVAYYIELIYKMMYSELHYGKEALRSMVSSLCYMISSLWVRHVPSQETDKSLSPRSKMILDRFIGLVKENHTKYRNVGFYADKLCLTPKYLSKLIKTASGRSAPDWIDSYVILEAKNLLKYSDITIKEIVYHLNFPNQSVFYKFFKARTGLTPSEYRKC